MFSFQNSLLSLFESENSSSFPGVFRGPRAAPAQDELRGRGSDAAPGPAAAAVLRKGVGAHFRGEGADGDGWDGG